MGKTQIPRHHLRNDPQVIAPEPLNTSIDPPPEHLPLTIESEDYLDPPSVTADHPYTKRQILQEDFQPISNPALHHYIKWATQSMASVVEKANLPKSQLTLLNQTIQDLVQRAGHLEPSDAIGVKQLRADLASFLGKTFLPSMCKTAQDVDDLPDDLIKSAGPVLTSHRFNVLAAAAEGGRHQPATTAPEEDDSSVQNFNNILRRYEAGMATHPNATAFASFPSVTVVQIHWSGGGEK